MFRLEQFGFRALWSPYFFLFLLVLTLIFFYVAKKQRHRFEGSELLTKKEGTLFIFTMLFLYIIKGSPIDLLGHLMFTFHMIQMAFLYLLIPQLIITSVPVWMWKKLLSLPVINKVFAFFTRPLIALIVFNGMFSFYHIPLIFDQVKTNIWYHALYTSILFLFAIFMWWPLINKVETEKRLSGLKKVGYLFTDSILITPACALIIFNHTPMYETYTNIEAWVQSLHLCVPADVISTLQLSGPEMFNLMSAQYDQQTGGVVMKILQEIIYGVILYRIMMDWYKREQEETDSFPIPGNGP